MQERRTLGCVVSGEVPTMDNDCARLCTGDGGADNTTIWSPFFLAASIPSRVGTLGLRGRGVAGGKIIGCSDAGGGTLVDLRCEPGRTRFAVVPFVCCCGDASPFRGNSLLGSIKPTSKRRASRKVSSTF